MAYGADPTIPCFSSGTPSGFDKTNPLFIVSSQSLRGRAGCRNTGDKYHAGVISRRLGEKYSRVREFSLGFGPEIAYDARMRLQRKPSALILGFRVCRRGRLDEAFALEFDRHTGQGGIGLVSLGLRATRKTAAAFLVDGMAGLRAFFV